MDELKLYKLLVTEDNEYGEPLASEIRWVTDDELLIWVSHLWFKEFIEAMTKMFGSGIFDDGSFDGNIQEDGICINLLDIVGGYGLDLKTTFPTNTYSQ